MEKKEIKIERPFTAAGVTLVPIAETSLNWWQHKGQLSLFGTKQPVGVVVVSPEGRKAFRISGEEISLDRLAEEVPEINEVLGEI